MPSRSCFRIGRADVLITTSRPVWFAASAASRSDTHRDLDIAFGNEQPVRHVEVGLGALDLVEFFAVLAEQAKRDASELDPIPLASMPILLGFDLIDGNAVASLRMGPVVRA